MNEPALIKLRDYGDYGIYVSPQDGRFAILGEDGQPDWVDSLTKAIEKLERAHTTKRVKVAVRCAKVDTGGYRSDKWRVVRGTLTGLHAGSGALLVKWEGEARPSQISRFSNNELLRDVSDDDALQLERLHSAYTEAEKAYESLLKMFVMDDPAMAVRNAIDGIAVQP